MVRPSYYDQLKDPRWQKRRLDRLNDAEWKCQQCGCETNTLHVHHKQYLKGRLAWEYEDAYLAVLCESCHSQEHLLETLLKAILAFNEHKMSGHAIAVGLVGGFMAGMGTLGDELSEPCEQNSYGVFNLGVIASLILSRREELVSRLSGVEASNEVERRALQWLTRKPNGTDQNN